MSTSSSSSTFRRLLPLLLLLLLLILLVLLLERHLEEEGHRGTVNGTVRRCCERWRRQRRSPPAECFTVRSIRCGPGRLGAAPAACSVFVEFRARRTPHPLSAPLHHRPRGLCTVVEDRRQLHGHRRTDVTVPCSELAVPATSGTPDAAII